MHQLYMSTNHLGIETAAAYLDALRRYGITHVIAYPSAASVLAHHARQQGTMVPGLRVAFANAEPLYPWQRAVIETGLGCAVRETYGMVEIAAAASECAKGALHLWPEAGHLEVLDDGADTPASAGKAGRFVCTGLFNVDMPLVRYAVGDRGMVNAERSCGCGRTLPVVASLEGRTTDTLVTPDGRSVHWVNPIFYGLPVLEGQVAQETVDRVRITVAPAPGFRDAHVAMLVERLRIRMGDVHVDVDQVRAIPRALNGKFRAVVCNVPRGERTRVVREPC
jgi:phenylacetate-CoA ligase